MFKPMLADDVDFSILTFPKMASVKLDGIRCVIIEGKAFTRSLKPIRNNYIREMLSKPEYDGLDGEILCAHPTDPDCYRKTNSAVMSVKGEPEFTFWVFDMHNRGVEKYVDCFSRLRVMNKPFVKVLSQHIVCNQAELDSFEELVVTDGNEGVMLRDPKALYKRGRSTAVEQILLKVKRFDQSECVVMEMVEEQENTNEKVTNALGQSERSSHKAGMVKKGTLGKVIVRDLASGVVFSIGSGFSKVERAEFWQNSIVGRILTYKFFAVGVKDLPRFPTVLGFRDESDMG